MRVIRRTRFGPMTIAVFVVVVLGAIVGAVLLGPGDEVARPSQAGPTTLTAATAGPHASLSVGATAAPSTVELPGSPELVFFQRQGDDLNLLGWRPGESTLGTRQVLTGALRGITERQSYQSQLSPDGSMVLVQASGTVPDAQRTFRAFRLDETGGREVWSSSTLGSNVVGGFIGREQVIVTSASQIPDGRGWTIVDLSGEEAVVHELDIPPVPRPSPGASIDFETLTLNYVPLAMSADGKYVYAMSVRGSEPLFRPAYRITIRTREAQPITAFPTTGPSRVVSALVDPLSGRLILAGARATSDRGVVEAWLPGEEKPDFKAAFNNVFGALWLDDGSVVTADYDRLPGPFSFRVIKLTPTGKVDATLFSAEGTNALLVGAERGFVAAYVASTATGMRTLVVVRLADKAIVSVNVPEPSGLNGFFGLRP